MFWLTEALPAQVWGPLVFESRRWVELRKQSFMRQLLSAESTGMGIFYTLNVFCIQVQKHFSPNRLFSFIWVCSQLSTDSSDLNGKRWASW